MLNPKLTSTRDTRTKCITKLNIYPMKPGSIYTIKIMESVYVCVCPAMRFVMLRGTELKVGMGVGDGPTRFVGIFSKWPHQRSKVIQRSSCFRSALWLPNLIGRSPDHGVMHCWGQRSCRVIWGQPGVKLLRNALWPPNLVGRIPDQTMMHSWGQRSCRGQLGQVGVSLLSNSLWSPNLVGRTSDQSIMHCWGQRSCRGQLWGQVGVNLLSNALWPPNLVGRTPDQSVMHCWGQRSCRGQPGSTRGQIA